MKSTVGTVRCATRETSHCIQGDRVEWTTANPAAVPMAELAWQLATIKPRSSLALMKLTTANQSPKTADDVVRHTVDMLVIVPGAI